MKRREETAQVAVVTGGSSGIGQSTAKALVAKGYHVYDFSRRDSRTAGVTHIRVDVTDETMVRQAVAQVLEQKLDCRREQSSPKRFDYVAAGTTVSRQFENYGIGRGQTPARCQLFRHSQCYPSGTAFHAKR